MSNMSFGDTGSYVDGAKQKKEPYWDEGINWFELPDDNEVHLYRFVAAPYYYAQHWVQTVKKDKTTGKAFPAMCQNFDSNTNTFAENGCELCAFMVEVNKALEERNKNAPIDPQTGKAKPIEWKDLPSNVTRLSRRLTMATNAIIRDLQLQGPPTNNSQGWSFIRPLRLPQGFSATIKEKQEKFNKRDGKVYALNHQTEGKDLQISYNSNSQKVADIYMMELGLNTPLTEEEMAQGGSLTNFASHMKYPAQKEMADALRRFGYYDWVNEFRASSPTTSVPRQAQVAHQQQAAPRAAQPAQNLNPAFAAEATPEPPFEPEPVAAATTPRPTASAAPQAPTPQPQQQPVAPPPVEVPTINPTASVAMQVQTPVVAPSQPVAAPVQATQPAGPIQPGVVGRLQDFAAQTGVKLIVKGTTYQKNLRIYTPDLAVPTCWATYGETSRANREQCKKCPMRLDCMMVT